MIKLINERRDYKPNRDNHLELKDLEVGDEVFLKYNKNRSREYNKLIEQKHRFIIVNLDPLIICLTSSKTEKNRKDNPERFPYNYLYIDDNSNKDNCIVKVDAYTEISVNDIFRLINYRKDIKKLKEILHGYNNCSSTSNKIESRNRSPLMRYTWPDGFEVVTRLSEKEFIKRYNRLDRLRVIFEGYDEDVGYSIWKKVSNAQNRLHNFTGIIKLNGLELDFMAGVLDDNKDWFDSEDIEAIEYYLNKYGCIY